MNRRRWMGGVLGAASCAGALAACTLTQSLDYLQKGNGLASDAAPDVQGADVVDGGGVVPVPLAVGQTKPGSLAQDATSLYWLAAGAVFSIPKTGGAPKQIGAVAPTATVLVADPDPAGAVFVAIGTDVTRIPKDGSAAGVVFKAAAGAPPADTIAANDSSLYVLQFDQTLAIDGTRILRMAKDGGGGVDIAPDAGPNGPITMNLDPDSVFWLNSDTDKPTFFQQGKSAAPGTASGTFVLSANDSLPSFSTDIAIDDGSLYWLSTDATSSAAIIVSRQRAAAAPVIPIYRGGPDDVFDTIAIDATHVYTFETKTGALLRVPKTGGGVEQLLTGLGGPSGLAVDATAIYFSVEATGDKGQVLKIVK